MILIWLAALVVLLDQLTKNIVVAVMAEGQSIPIYDRSLIDGFQ